MAKEVVEDYLHELPSQSVRVFPAKGREIHCLPGAIGAKDNKGNTAHLWKAVLLLNRVATERVQETMQTHAPLWRTGAQLILAVAAARTSGLISERV